MALCRFGMGIRIYLFLLSIKGFIYKTFNDKKLNKDMAHTEHTNVQGGGLKNPVVKRLLVVTLYLSIFTAIEFVIAFVMDASMLKNSIFAVLTVFKAFYIVGEFMHLKHEAKTLIWSILIPLAFILWFIIALLKEGSAHP